MSDFAKEIKKRIDSNGEDADLQQSAENFMRTSYMPRYSYNFGWLGRPIIQYPQDMVALQELIWKVRPNLIIETGIAHGGSLIFSASMLALLDLCSENTSKNISNMGTSLNRLVLGIDIDIRDHNRREIESHPLNSYIRMVEGSSTSCSTVNQVREIASQYDRVLVCLDSNHTHEHVLAELDAYAPLTSVGSYCVVFDTLIGMLPEEFFPDRPWGPGDNPITAVAQFLENHPEFESDKDIDNKLLISAAPNGYLKRSK